MRVSIYPPHVRSNDKARAVDLTWEEFTAWLAKVQETEDKHYQAFSPLGAIQPGEGGRIKGGPASFLALEYDDDATPELLADVCEGLEEEGIASIIYTSASATDDCPRFRVILRVDRPIRNDAEYRAAVDAFGEWMGVPPAKESRQRTRIWYRPIRGAQVWRIEGWCSWAIEEREDAPAREAEPVDLSKWTGDERVEQAWLALNRRHPTGGYEACVICHDYRLDEAMSVALVTQYGRTIGWTEFGELPRCAQNAAAYARGPSGGALEVESVVAVKSAASSVLVGYHTFNDSGNADRLLSNFGEDLRYVRGRGWYEWDGSLWVEAPHGPVAQAEACAAAVLAEGLKVGGDEGKALKAWGLQSGNSGRLRACADLARSRPGVGIDAGELDNNLWALSVGNGTVDLLTGQLRAPAREDLSSIRTDVKFVANATCPRFEQFLLECMDGSHEWVGYLRRWMGYALTGSMTEQQFGLWHGAEGANGKSTLLAALSYVLGPYMGTCAPDLLLMSGQGQHPTGMADLHGRRLMVTSEIAAGARINERVLKQVSGGDPVRARRIGQDFFEFRPQCKLVLAANSLPRTAERGQSLWRRCQTVPWEVSFADREDHQLWDTLRGEAEGILAYAVRGCLEWQCHRLGYPEAGRRFVEAYRQEQDPFEVFLEECVERAPGEKVKRQELYDAYTQWCFEAKLPYPLSRIAFMRVMREHGCDEVSSHGIRYVCGWKLTS